MRIFLPLLFVLGSCSSASAPRAVPASALENAHELIPGLYSGAEPEGAEGFRQLVALGVRTIISVDGAKPDVEAARKAGLRYVHLPIGYDGITYGRALELGKAIVELPGPIYLHCHHGKHRAPAAAAVGCVVAGKISNEQAVRFMKTMGTGEQYLGLWKAAEGVTPADAQLLKDTVAGFPEVSPPEALTGMMVALDHAFEHLGLCRAAGWKKPAKHPDLDPAHEALQARELLAEFQRTPGYSGRPARFRELMESGRQAAAGLEEKLRTGSTSDADALYTALTQSCTDCHKPYRNRSRK